MGFSPQRVGLPRGNLVYQRLLKLDAGKTQLQRLAASSQPPAVSGWFPGRHRREFVRGGGPGGLLKECSGDEGAAETFGGEGRNADGDEAIGGDGRFEGQLEEVVGNSFRGARAGNTVVIGTDGDGGKGAGEELGAKGAGFFGDQSAQRRHAFADSEGRDRVLAVELPGGGAGAGGKREKVQIGEGLGGNEIAALLEERVGFTGEADHDVGADGCAGEQSANFREALGIVPGAITAIHAAKNDVRAGLQGQVGVTREAREQVTGCGGPGGRSSREFAIEGEKAWRPVHGLDGAEAEARKGGLAQDRVHEVFEVPGGLEVASPAAKVDTGQHKFLASAIDECTNVGEAGGERNRAAGSAGGGDDAEGTAIGAAVLDLEVRARLPGIGGERESGELSVGEGVVVENGGERHEGVGYGGARAGWALRNSIRL